MFSVVQIPKTNCEREHKWGGVLFYEVEKNRFFFPRSSIINIFENIKTKLQSLILNIFVDTKSKAEECQVITV